ncbi:hypothetical protein [Streptomyces sp. NPDC002346]
MTEQSRDDRIETYYEQSAWDLAERVVDLEDELAAAERLWRDRERENGELFDKLMAAENKVDKLREMYKEGRADAEYFEEWATGNGHRLNDTLVRLRRYRLAWLSARLRAADEANFAMEALDLKDAEIARLKAELADLREAIHGD